MIRSSESLAAAFKDGRTIARLTEMGGGTHFRWVLEDTNEPVHGQAIKTLQRKGLVRVVASDLCGEPMQYGAA